MNLDIGQEVTFRVPPRGEDIRGFVVAMDLTEIDGIDTSELDEPVHTVSSDGGLWAIHPSWVIS
jgi:hypothetical protein